MKKLIGMIKRRRSLVLTLAFAPMCFGVLISAESSQQQEVKKRAQPVSPVEVKIINNTTTLEATFEITATNHLLIRLKNLSSKDMNAYVVELNNKRITNDLSIGDRFISLHQTDELEMPIPSPSTTVTILAAMFTDGTIEAEPVLKTELSEWRLGLKEELVRGLAEVDEILESSDVYSTKALDRLGTRLSSPRKSDTGPSPSASGFQEARYSLNAELQSLKERAQRNGNGMQRQRLLDLKSRIERRIARL